MALEQEVSMDVKDEHAAGSRGTVVVGLRLVVAVAAVRGAVVLVGPVAAAVADAAQRVLETEQMEPSSRLSLYSAVSLGWAVRT